MNSITTGNIKPDNKPFSGKTIFETKTITEVTANEMQLLEIIRSIEYGEVTAKKQKGAIIQILRHESVAPKEIAPKLY
jgi:Asp-tRNA(Asn)/Glu-tRNA(Gln) amidotransferase B subunit